MARKQKKRKEKRRESDRGGGEALLAQAVQAHHGGDLATAERRYRQYLRRNPGNGEVWHSFGGLLYQIGEIAGAVEALERATALRPSQADPASDLGGVYLSQERFDDAERAFRSAIKIAPTAAGPQYNLSIALYSQGRTTESIAVLDRLVNMQPDFAEAHYNLGVALRTEGKLKPAIVALEKAYTLQPDNPNVMLELARASREIGASERAAKLYLKLLGYSRDSTTLVECAEVLHEGGETQRALDMLEGRLADEPSDEEVYVCLGRLRHNSGDILGAERALRDGLSVNPNSAAAIMGLSRIRRVTDPEDPGLALMLRLLEESDDDEEQRASLHFSIAKIYDDLARYDDAFAHFSQGNAIKHQRIRYDAAATEQTYKRIIEYFDRNAIDELTRFGNASDVPVLIVGMPRSGTTLVEQVISSHSKAAGAGELAFFTSLAAQLPQRLDSETPYPGCLAGITDSAANSITGSYLDLLRRHSRDAFRVTDKLPGNYLHVGLFKGLFPNGRVIVCQRDPLDVVLSIYFQYFGRGHDYAWDLADIAHQYAQYDRVMRHWSTLLPGSILEVDYAQTVHDLETVARQLIAHCDLPWEDRCLEFYRTKRDVKTASNWQVRQPIYATSLARWKNYQRHIEPLIETLRPLRVAVRE